MKRRPAVPSVLLAAALVAVPSLLEAQGLTYVQTTRTEMGGALGGVMAMMGGMGDPQADTMRVQGALARTDRRGTSTILDMESGDVINLDHRTHTFTRFNFLEMMEAMGGMNADAMMSAADRAELERQREEQPEVEVQARISTDRTGRTETIAGYRAEQVILTMELVAETPPDPEAEDPLQRGQMAVVTELWLSTEFPEWQLMQERGREMAERMRAGAMGGGMAAMGGMGSMGGAGMDGRISKAWEENAEALKELEGHALRTTVHFVTVPPDLELDREAVLEAADQPLSEGGPASVADAARQALGGRLGGLFGRGRQEEPEEPEMTQSVFMRMTTEIVEAHPGDIPAAVFEVPADYTERELPMPVRR